MSILKNAITHARSIVSQYSPLPNFIAVNPLWSMTDNSFSHASSTLYTVATTMPVRFYNNLMGQHIIPQDLSAAIAQITEDEDSVGLWQDYLANMQDIEHRECAILYAQQLKVWQFDDTYDWVKAQCNQCLLHFFAGKHNTNNLLTYWFEIANPAKHASRALNLSAEPTAMIQQLFEQLGIQPVNYQSYLQQIILSVYGWSSLIKWLEAHPNNPWIDKQAQIEMVLIMWLCCECQLLQKCKKPYDNNLITTLTNSEKKHISAKNMWQKAYDLSHLRQLTSKLKPITPQLINPPVAQLLFCIDTRSEGLRRHLEALGDYTTYGFAGFFGFAFKLKHENEQTTLQCPALLDPDIILKRQKQYQSFFSSCKVAFAGAVKETKESILAPYVLFEFIGIWLLKLLTVHAIAPQLLGKKSTPIVPEPIDFDDENCPLELNDAIASAKQLLMTIGLHNNFAKTVVICAHQSTSSNNPFASTLDCGACGGNSGIPNAIVASSVLNHERVRRGLHAHGISIPKSTQFIAACHHTVRDEVELFSNNPPKPLVHDLAVACKHLRAEKFSSLPGNRSPKRREKDWSELIPELGLVNNASMIIGPRRLSAGANLQRRTFLHSYEPDQDTDGSILESIMCAPMIVAHWINSQYYFSTVAPDYFGSGNKAIHNVVPSIGVMQGNLSDLNIGLPDQSLYYKSQLLHQPIRLGVVIFAPEDRVEAIFSKHQHLANLRDGDWVNVYIIDPKQQDQ